MANEDMNEMEPQASAPVSEEQAAPVEQPAAQAAEQPAEPVKAAEGTAPAPAPAPRERRRDFDGDRGERGERSDRDDDDRPHRSDKKRFFYTKKVCKFCTGQIDEKHIDYKNIDVLRRYVMPSGKIVPRRITGNCARHQRMVTTEIKKARVLAFLPYVDR